MASSEPDKTVKLWMKRIHAADKAREAWETEYDIPKCRQYWKGLQRDTGDEGAIVNRILPTVRTRMPGLYFYHPFARVEASPAKTDTPAQTVEDNAKLLQDTLNTFIRDPKTGFQPQTTLSLKEAHWAFGCIEVGYTAEFTENPAFKQTAPPLKEEKETEGVQGAQKPALGAELLAPPDPMAMADPMAPMAPQGPQPPPYVGLNGAAPDECIYVRRIPPRQVLISSPEATIVDELDWLGYWEYQNVEDVKKAPAYKNTSKLKGSTREDREESGDTETSAQEVKIYKIWDQRTKTRYVFAEGHDKCLLKESFKRRKLFFLRFEEEPDKFRGIPPIYNWLSSQDEYNESREFIRMQRITRVPRYTVGENGVRPDEVEKFENNIPNTWIMRRDAAGSDVISPVMQPNMSDSALQSLTLSREEFDEVTGVGAEARQQASSDTATQAAIMNQRQNILDTYDRSIVANWLGEIAREMILTAIDEMALPKWIKLNTDPNSPAAQMDSMLIAQQYQQITQTELQDASDSLRWEVAIDVESLSPVSEQEKAQQWMQMLTIITNPTIAPILATSPEMLKRTLDLGGIKNAKDQAAIAQALAMQAAIPAQMAAAQVGAPGVAPMGGGPPPGAGTQKPPRPPKMIPGPTEAS